MIIRVRCEVKNQEKDQLRRLVIREIKAERDCQETVARLKRLGYRYNASTVKRYYEALS